MATQFLVLPYRIGKRNKLEAQQALPCRTEGDAQRRGERMAAQVAGVVVVRQDYDETADFAGEPFVLATFGKVPEEWDDAKRAA